MPRVLTSTENNFTKGLITEATGLNFPENAATDCENVEFTLIGDVIRREGINFETGGTTNTVSTASQAMSEYLWKNAGGDGLSELVVQQIGQSLYFYLASNATVSSPLSKQLLGNVNQVLTMLPAAGGSFDATRGCNFADGNGYLFVYHPSCDPQFVTYNPGSQLLSIAPINLQIRDFVGVIDGLAVNTRPSTLSTEHNYNIQNQGWTSGNSWQTSSVTALDLRNGTTNYTLTVGSGLTTTTGQTVRASSPVNIGHRDAATGAYTLLATSTATITGSLVSYSVNTMVVNVSAIDFAGGSPYYPNPNVYGGTGEIELFGSPQFIFADYFPWTVSSLNANNITTWNTAEGNFPSNADVWWYFKDTTGAFAPGTTQPSVSIGTGNAPQGHYILPAFNLDRSAASGITGITPVTTKSRPTNGCWFQGRVWYTGANGFQAPNATSDVSFYTWTENIYFSQVVMTPTDFGTCYQANDPTSEQLFDLLPTDGGVITQPGTGTIYKLFPIQNGLLVFAANGVWFITGSTGIGFAANDYTMTKISSIKTLSTHSFVDVNGLPIFWNEEGIYMVEPSQSGSLTVNPITVGTILSFYNNIPTISKQYVRGAYDPINYIVQWTYRSTPETSIANRYKFDSILNYNIYNKAFYPFSVDNSVTSLNGILYVNYPNSGPNAPEPGFKYPSSTSSVFTFADEHDSTFVDWGNINYSSFFVVGYKVHGSGIFKFQFPYVYVYSRNNDAYAAYNIQGLWDFANNFDSNRWSQPQFIEVNDFNSAMSVRRHKIRGRGVAVQLKFTSVDGQPFDIMGWAIYETLNTGV